MSVWLEMVLSFYGVLFGVSPYHFMLFIVQCWGCFFCITFFTSVHHNYHKWCFCCTAVHNIILCWIKKCLL